MRHQEMAITPALAEQFLKMNVVNRKHVRLTWVDTLASEMKQGSFRMTHQGIAFNTKGELLDGQHRLLAIIKSGCTVMMDVAFDCPAETAMEWPVDRGAMRSVGDAMGISPTEASLMDAILALWKRSRSKFTTQERRATWDLFRVHFATIQEMCNTSRKTVSQVAIKVPVLLRILQHGESPGLQYRAFVLMDFPAMWPSVQALTRQLTVAQIKRKEPASVMMARAWIAFDPAKKNVSRIQINDHSTQMSEMRDVLASTGLGVALERITGPEPSAVESIPFPPAVAS